MDPRADDGKPPLLNGTAAWVLAVQCLLALSWTLYVLFLPDMLAAAGIARRWFVYVLIADQVIFAACDWFAGVHADRIAARWRRVGRVVLATSLLSSAALLSMPWIARGGNAALLLAIIFLWAATSSALRAPVFALLGRIRDTGTRGRRPGLVGMALVGIGLAGAIGPYVTLALKTVDPRLPIAVSALALVAAGLWAGRAEASLPRIDTRIDTTRHGEARSTVERRRAWSLAAIVLIAGFGTQLVTAVVAVPMLQRFVGAQALVWAAWFWIGFTIGVVPGSRVAARDIARGQPLLAGASALVVACVAYGVAVIGDTLAFVAAGLAVTGAAWGFFTTVAFSSALAVSGGRATANGAGTASGLLFSALAVGTLMRLACVAAGVTKATLIGWLPAIAWAAAAALLVAVVRRLWRRPLPEIATPTA